MNWEGIWNDIKLFFTGNAWSILWFFVALFFGIIVIRIVISVLKRLFARSRLEKIAQQFVLTAVKFLLGLVLVLILLSMVGVEVTGVLTALSAVLLAVGIALENNIANLANGIVIVASHMFKKGDYIIVDGKEGSITDINFLFTTLITPDNKKVTLPNSTIVNSSVINAGANKTRRVDFTFEVAYETDVEKAKKIVTDCMMSNGKIYLEEGKMPFCRLKVLGASGIDLFANCWCDNEDYWEVYYDVTETVYNEFKKYKISIPYPQTEVRMRTDTVVLPYDGRDLPARVEKQRPAEKPQDFIGSFEQKREERKARKEKKQEQKKD